MYSIIKKKKKREERDFPGAAVDRNLPSNATDMGLIPDPGRFHMPQDN